MVSGCSTLVQFQALHEIRALHYKQLKAALPSFKIKLYQLNVKLDEINFLINFNSFILVLQNNNDVKNCL